MLSLSTAEPDAVELLLATLRLGREPADTVALNASWESADPRGLAALIDFEGCALWLLRRLKQIGAHGLLRSELGRTVTWFAHNTAARNMLIDAETETVLSHVAARNIPCILMKGAARRALGEQLPFAEARPTQDLDILVPEYAAPELWDYLRTQGFELAHPERKPRPWHHHLPGLIGPDGVTVEIHISIAPEIPPQDAWSRIRATAIPIQRFGVWTLVPSPTEMLWNGVLHAMRNGARGFRLHQLLVAASIIASRHADALLETRARLARGTARDIASPALARAWLDSALWLGGLGTDSAPAVLRRALKWRLTLVRRFPGARYGDHKTLGAFADEASRIEFDLPAPRGIRQGLRPIGAALMRNAYRCWRLAFAS